MIRRLQHFVFLGIAVVALGLLRGLLSLPDKVLKHLAEGLGGVARTLKLARLHQTIEDFREIVAAGPPASGTLRRFIFEARPRQARLIIVGALKNHFRAW